MLPWFQTPREEREKNPNCTASLLLSFKTAVYCIQIKARQGYETSQLVCGIAPTATASPQTEGVTHSRDGEAILSFWKGTLAAAALSAFIIICHYSLAICSDLGKWF